MLHIILFEPEIPPNTGNIIRLAANTGAHLHLIEPMKFSIDDKQLKRAGLDYHDSAKRSVYASWEDFCLHAPTRRLFFCSTKGSKSYTTPQYAPGDGFVFGPESRGLPSSILETAPEGHILRLPMTSNSRSLNLANSVGIFLYEACRQVGFDQLEMA